MSKSEPLPNTTNPKAVEIAEKEALVELLKTTREQRKLTQKEMARIIGVSQARIAQIETNNATERVSYDVLLHALRQLNFNLRVIHVTTPEGTTNPSPHLIIRGKCSGQVCGFSTENKQQNSGGELKVLVKGTLTSDEGDDFHRIADSIATNFIFPTIKDITLPSLAALGHYLILLLADGSFEIHLNFATHIECLAKRNLNAGEAISISDIASIRRLRFHNITIPPKTGIIYHFTEGYRHAIYIDLTPINGPDPINQIDLEYELADCYQRIQFEKHFGDKQILESMLDDGWFPFIAIPKDLFDNFYLFYGDPAITDKAAALRSHFSGGTLEELSSKWFKKESYKDLKPFVETALKNYRDKDYISSISVLYPRIEGLLTKLFSSSKTKADLPWLFDRLSDRAMNNVGKNSLLMPRNFRNYLKKFLGKSFDTHGGKVGLSRHSHAHGVTPAEEYSQDKAVIGFLILDQISYYLGNIS